LSLAGAAALMPQRSTFCESSQTKWAEKGKLYVTFNGATVLRSLRRDDIGRSLFGKDAHSF